MEQSGDRWINRRIEALQSRYQRACFEVATVLSKTPPDKWAEQNIFFTRAVNAAYSRFDPALTPYLSDILKAWDYSGVKREITVVAPEQTGKSLSWIIPLLWSFIYRPGLSLIVYPSDELADRINTQRVEPLAREIPQLAAELDVTGTKRKDCYHFSSSKCYFMGAGSRITSMTANLMIADEIDDWIRYNEQVFSLDDLRKRSRTFSESLLHKCCTPTNEYSPIWREFKKSSQGYWHLRCLGCGELTIRSADVYHLEWETDKEKEDVVEGTLRLICPKCKHQHTEDQKREMNVNGGYIHLLPERLKEHPGFQWGALASQMPGLEWVAIARAQLLAGKSGFVEDQRLFDNSFRGLPFTPRRENDNQTAAIIKRMQALPSPSDIQLVVIAADTQDDCFYYRVRGIDINGNTYSLSPEAQVPDLSSLELVGNKEYLGKVPAYGIIDAGGHRTQEVLDWVNRSRKWFAYKGDSRIPGNWIFSRESRRMILAKSKVYQARLLYYLYSQTNPDNNYMFFHPEETMDTIKQITDFHPNFKQRGGRDYENWISSDYDHLFDCEKMILVLIDVLRKWGKLKADKNEVARKKIERNRTTSFVSNSSSFLSRNYFF